VIAEYVGIDPRNHNKVDQFLAKHIKGNDRQAVNHPFERLQDCENLMRNLRSLDAEKYTLMHKGTPFFFMAWLSFDMGNFEKALFYLDAAISEDARNGGDGWRTLPGADLLKLGNANAARRTVVELRGILQGQMDRFNAVSGRKGLTLAEWVKYFVEPMMETEEKRTILCSIYVFFYEYRDRFQELELRAGPGSNHPFLSHLLLGGLIFESLLKQWYQRPTLGQLFDRLRPDFAIPSQADLHTNANVPNPFAVIYAGIAGNNDVVTAFTTTAKLRNTTGHNLDRDNIFDQSNKYTDLFQQVVNAIFYVVSVKYLP